MKQMKQREQMKEMAVELAAAFIWLVIAFVFVSGVAALADIVNNLLTK